MGDARKQARTVCCAAGHGTTTPGTCGLLAGTGTGLPTGTTTLASAWPKLNSRRTAANDQGAIRSVFFDRDAAKRKRAPVCE
nr:hypothetical protein [uncultured Desulfobacter sp.]